MSKNLIWALIISFLLVSVLVFWLSEQLQQMQPTDKAVVLGVIAGGAISVITTIIATLISSHLKSKEIDVRFKETISQQAMDLAKMECDLRLRGTRKKILAPAKVYREFFFAIQGLITTGSWTKKIEEEGLLNVIEIEEKDSSI